MNIMRSQYYQVARKTYFITGGVSLPSRREIADKLAGRTPSAVVAFGLRGNAYRSEDWGGSWSKVETGLPASLVAGASLPGGALVLADAGGRVAVSRDDGRSFKGVPMKQTMPLAGIADAGDGRLALVGLRGVALAELSAR